MTNNRRCIYRTRQISTNGIQQSLNPLILKRRPAKHRYDLHCQSSFANSGTYLIFRNCSRIIKEFFHQCIIAFRSFFKHFFTPFFSLFLQTCRNFFNTEIRTHRFIMPINSLHSDQVDQSFECFFRSNRNNNRTRICTEYVFQLTHYFKEVCP